MVFSLLVAESEPRMIDPDTECHRRGCEDTVAFVARERYAEETGAGIVEAEAYLCRTHARAESPANLDASIPEYRFVVEPIGDSAGGE